MGTIILKVGDKAPDFSAPDQDGTMVELDQFAGEWLLLYFYPKDFTPGCTKEACVLRDRFYEMADRVKVVGISADSVDSHARFVDKHGLPFSLLSDEKREIISEYGVDGTVFPKRTSFLIRPDGTIAKIYAGVKPVEHAQEVITDLELFQTENDEHM